MEEYRIDQLKVLGLEVGKIPIPKWLHRYEDKPLSFYRVFMKYKGCHCVYRKKEFSGHCALILKTSIENHGGLAVVKGHIYIRNYSTLDLPLSNYVPKGEINCPQLYDFVASYIGSCGLGDRFFNYDTFGDITNELFSCKLDSVPLVNINNPDNTLDMVSIDMDLFKPI